MAFNIEILDDANNIDLITIYDGNSEIKFTNFGMRIVDWKVDGRSIVLGPNENDDLVQYYEENPYFFGATIGRYGGRIENGTFELNGQNYKLEQNDAKHNLHGGSNGLHSRVFDYEIINEDKIVTVIYTADMKSEDDYFPGNIQIRVTHRYDLIQMMWSIHYEATSTEDTLFNPMNHVYFNLNKTNQTIENHRIHNEIEFYPLKENQIVKSLDTVNINEEIGKEILTFRDVFESGLSQIKQFNGIDHPVKLGDESFTVSNDELEIEMKTDQDHVVIFTLNDVDWNDHDHTIQEHGGFTLETQSIPDDIHLLGDSAPSILRNGKTFSSETSYQIKTKDK